MFIQEIEEDIMHGQPSHEEKDLYRDTPLRYLGNISFPLLAGYIDFIFLFYKFF